MQIALRTVLAEGARGDHDPAHKRLPEALARKLRAAGVRDRRIRRDGRHVFQPGEEGWGPRPGPVG